MALDSMPVIGVLGGVASGKSTAGRLMAQHGGALIDADRIGHEVLELPEVKRKLQDEFGDEVLTPEGTVNRDILGRLVFGWPKRLPDLNAIVHPLILDVIERRIRKLAQTGDAGFVVLDAALLLETGLQERWCDALVFVDAPESVRVERAHRERGWSPEQLSQRDAVLIPLEAKEELAGFVIHNSGTVEQLEQAVRAVMVEVGKQLSL